MMEEKFTRYDSLKPKEQHLVDAFLAEEGQVGALKRVADRTGLSYAWVRQKVLTPRIKMAIEDRRTEMKEQSHLFVQAAVDIAQPVIDRIGRMQRLSVIADNMDESTATRMRAIELLGKMEGDFVERTQQIGPADAPRVSPVSLRRRIEQITGEAEPEPEAPEEDEPHNPFR